MPQKKEKGKAQSSGQKKRNPSGKERDRAKVKIRWKEESK